MKPNFNQLAMRDQAMAASLGLDFGKDSRFGGESQFGGYEFGTEFGADTSTQATSARERVLEPNKGSQAKIQRYGFAVNFAAVTLGTPSLGISAFNNPQTKFRPQRITVNVPEPNFFMLSSIQVANVNVLVGGVFDGYDFNANGQDQQLDLPTITPANQVTVTGNYTGDLAGRAGTYLITCSFKGPANIVA